MMMMMCDWFGVVSLTVVLDRCASSLYMRDCRVAALINSPTLIRILWCCLHKLQKGKLFLQNKNKAIKSADDLHTAHGVLHPAFSVLHPAFAHAPQPLSVPLSLTYPADKPFVRACLFLRARVWPGLVNELALGIHEFIWLSAEDRFPRACVCVCVCVCPAP